MSTASDLVKRSAIALLLVDVLAVSLIAGTLRSVSQRADRNEESFVALARDVTRLSQAQASAERMVAIGRGYLLTVEPELLARSQAAEAKLARTLQSIGAGHDADAAQELEPVLSSAKQYRRIFSTLLSGEVVPRGPREVAQALRQQLIPARDDLLSELDELIAARLGQLEAARISGREQRTKAVHVVVVAGVFAVLASAYLLWILLAGARAVARSHIEQPDGRGAPPDGSRLASVYQFPRRRRTPRPPS